MTAKREIKRLFGVMMLVTTLVASGRTSLGAQAPEGRLIVVTMDGVRWQEVFDGADRSLITGRDGGVDDSTFALQRFWRPTAAARREALFPFLTRTVGGRGTLLGDSARGSVVRVTNGRQFSYPGYNELFAGQADPRIDSNDKVPNPNVTVLEWLAGRPGFANGIEVFGSWDVFPWIFNVDRSALPVNAHGPPFAPASTEREELFNRMAAWLPEHWRGSRLDAPAMAGALEAMRTRAPRVLVVLLGETDEWAHQRRYDLYLDAARRADRFMAELWEMAESLPAYRGRTRLLVSTDHGRGPGRDWTDHGRDLPAAARIWMGAVGPGVRALGVDSRINATQSQFAATLALLVGEDWQSARVSVGRAISELMEQQ